MKYLIKLNFFALGLPFAIGIISILNPELLLYAFLSTMVTGALQIVIAIVLLYINRRNNHLYTYFFITAVFFTLLLLYIENIFIWCTPVFLAIYLTYILHRESEKSKL